MNRLASCMYWDCMHDMELDSIIGKRSPDAEYAQRAAAELRAERKPDPVYDAIMPDVEQRWWL